MFADIIATICNMIYRGTEGPLIVLQLTQKSCNAIKEAWLSNKSFFLTGILSQCVVD